MDQQKITISIIESKDFRVAARGYDQHEVDEFLDDICDEMERMEHKMAELESQLEKAHAERRKAEAATGVVRPAPVAADGSVNEILTMAQQLKEQTLEAAKTRAAEIVANAQNEVDARLGNLEQEKARLTEEVEALRAAAKDYKERFTAMLKECQSVLDKVEEL